MPSAQISTCSLAKDKISPAQERPDDKFTHSMFGLHCALRRTFKARIESQLAFGPFTRNSGAVLRTLVDDGSPLRPRQQGGMRRRIDMDRGARRGGVVPCAWPV